MKQLRWFLLSGLLSSLAAVQSSVADDQPLSAEKPGQVTSEQKTTTPPEKKPQPAPEQNTRKLRVTSRATGETDMRNFMGVVTEPIPAALAAQLDDQLKSGQGVGVKLVVPDSPAQAAGLKTFDVLTTYNGKAITSSDALRKFVLSSPKDATIKLEIIRASKKQTVEITLIQKLFRYYKFSVYPMGQKANIAKNPKAPSPSQPGNDGPIASRSTESDPIGRKAPLGFSHIPVTTTHNLCILFVGNVKGDYSVEVSYQDETDNLQTNHFKGSPREISEQVVDLPEHVQVMINERLKELKLALQGKASFRLQIKPHMQGKARFIRVFLSRATKEKTVRMVELDHHLGNRPKLNVNQILANQVFTQELKELTPAIQEQIRATLQRIRIPTVQVRVDNPI